MKKIILTTVLGIAALNSSDLLAGGCGGSYTVPHYPVRSSGCSQFISTPYNHCPERVIVQHRPVYAPPCQQTVHHQPTYYQPRVIQRQQVVHQPRIVQQQHVVQAAPRVVTRQAPVQYQQIQPQAQVLQQQQIVRQPQAVTQNQIIQQSPQFSIQPNGNPAQYQQQNQQPVQQIVNPAQIRIPTQAVPQNPQVLSQQPQFQAVPQGQQFVAPQNTAPAQPIQQTTPAQTFSPQVPQQQQFVNQPLAQAPQNFNQGLMQPTRILNR